MDNKVDNIVNHSERSEKAIERYLCAAVKKMGGICLKYSNANAVGYPDRVALLPTGVTIWFEVKSKGKRLTKMQSIRHAGMRLIGHAVYVVDNKDEVNNILKTYGYAV